MQNKEDRFLSDLRKIGKKIFEAKIDVLRGNTNSRDRVAMRKCHDREKGIYF